MQANDLQYGLVLLVFLLCGINLILGFALLRIFALADKAASTFTDTSDKTDGSDGNSLRG